MKVAAYIGGLLGLTLLAVILVRTDLPMMWHTAALAGGKLLWLAPYRLLLLLLFALGWAVLLRPYDPGRRLGLGYVYWVTTVREAIDRLLPVASVGGAFAGVRLMRRRGIALVPASATIIVEILLTLIALYLFSALGVLLLIGFNEAGASYRYLLPALLCSLPIPAVITVLLRYGTAFTRLEGVLRRLVGINLLSEDAISLDQEIKACLRRTCAITFAGALQFAALLAGSLEIWFVLRVAGHPVGAGAAVIMESLMQGLRHLAFVVPAGVGVQEAGLIAFGQLLGVSSELALTVSLAKRLREVMCGVPSLISWVLVEGRWLGVGARSTQPAFRSVRDIGLFLTSARSDARLDALRHESADSATAFDRLYQDATQHDPWASSSPQYQYQRRKYDAMIAMLPQRRYRRALDLGCGLGLFTERLASLSQEVLGVDISAVAVRCAAERTRALNNVQMRQGDFMTLGVDGTGEFDLIVVADTIYYLPAPIRDAALEHAVAEISKLLAPDGILLLVNHYFPLPLKDTKLTLRIHRAFHRSPNFVLLAEHKRAFFLASLLSKAPTTT